MERGFNDGQTHSIAYPFIFNRLRAIPRYWSEIATFSYPLAFNAPIGGDPLGRSSWFLVGELPDVQLQYGATSQQYLRKVKPPEALSRVHARHRRQADRRICHACMPCMHLPNVTYGSHVWLKLADSDFRKCISFRSIGWKMKEIYNSPLNSMQYRVQSYIPNHFIYIVFVILYTSILCIFYILFFIFYFVQPLAITSNIRWYCDCKSVKKTPLKHVTDLHVSTTHSSRSTYLFTSHRHS